MPENPLGLLRPYGIVIAHEGGIKLLTEGGIASVAPEEVVPSGTPWNEPVRPLRYILPYGIAALENGVEVLFNRDYEPLWRRQHGSAPVPMDRSAAIGSISRNRFYDDGSKPWKNQMSLDRCLRVLSDWGISEPSQRLSLDWLPGEAR